MPSKEMRKLGFRESELQPGFYVHTQRELRVITHVDDFLCTGPQEDLLWFKAALGQIFDISGQCMDDINEETQTKVRVLKFLRRRITKTELGYEENAAAPPVGQPG